ncbi:MAG: hypothetical protein H6Q10_1328 [Acidobacteria bacterium]|jgi:Sec-independent protein translocase protein TatA|nr:hypothetical protein [Acidobacteriota bacterium]
MAAPHEARFLTLGWQSWAVVAVVVMLVILAGMLLLVW